MVPARLFEWKKTLRAAVRRPGLAAGAALLAAVSLLASASGASARCEDFVPQPKPQNASRDIVGAEFDAIVDRGWIEFAAFEDYAPWSWEDGGRPRGVDVEIGRLIAEELGVEARFRFVAAGENLDADLRNHVWKGPLIGGRVANVLLHVPYDSEFACRIEQVVFTGQGYEERLAIAYALSAYPEDPPTPAYFRFDSVAVENDTISDFYLSTLAGGQLKANIERHQSYAAAMAALNAGAVKAVMGPRAALQHWATDAIGLHEPPFPGLAKARWTVGVAVNYRYRPLAYAVDAAIETAIADGRIAAIFEKAGLTWSPPER